MFSEYELKRLLCDIGKRTYERGFVAANDGNFSVRLSKNEFLCTPTGVSKGFMTPDMMCLVNENGEPVMKNSVYKPSSEIKMHMRVYKARDDVNAVVHAHPPYATGFAICGMPLNRPIVSEAVMMLGCVPVTDYATPSTNEVPDSVEKYLCHFDQLLLANHGALSWGTDLLSAYHKMESLEFYAKLTAISSQIGEPKPLSREQVLKLYEIRRKMGLPGRHPAEICIGKGQYGGGCHGEQCGSGGSGEKKLTELSETKSAAYSDAEASAIVAEVTKRVIAGLNL